MFFVTVPPCCVTTVAFPTMRLATSCHQASCHHCLHRASHSAIVAPRSRFWQAALYSHRYDDRATSAGCIDVLRTPHRRGSWEGQVAFTNKDFMQNNSQTSQHQNSRKYTLHTSRPRSEEECAKCDTPTASRRTGLQLIAAYIRYCAQGRIVSSTASCLPVTMHELVLRSMSNSFALTSPIIPSVAKWLLHILRLRENFSLFFFRRSSLSMCFDDSATAEDLPPFPVNSFGRR